jgi:thiamine-phosphate pyrophosphorylase
MPTIDFNLYLITDRLNLPDGKNLLDQVEAALRGGVKAVQLREKDLLFHDLLPMAQQLRTLTRQYGAKLLINGNFDIALSVDADGAHLPSDNPPIELARNILGDEALIGVSTHSLAEVQTAEAAGADFVTFGPVYPTPSKAQYGAPVGFEKLREVCEVASIPVFALGGVTSEKVTALRGTGCSCFACIGAILNSDDPATVAKKFLIA